MNMAFSKSTLWRETDDLDKITWGFDERGGKQVDREGDYSSLYWSDSLGNSGTLDDELGPIIPIEEEEEVFTIKLGYQLDTCLFNEVYVSSESIEIREDDIELIFAMTLDNDMIDQGIATWTLSEDLK